MPEGPEVRQITSYLNEQLTGKQIQSIEYNSQSKYRNGIKDYDAFSDHLPVTVSSVTCKGKCIVFICNDGADQTVYITSTLGMEGFWTVGTEPFNKHSNLWFNLSGEDESENLKAYFNDSCKFGNLTLFVDFDQFRRKMSEIGPDYLLFSVALHENHVEELTESEQIPFDKWNTNLKSSKWSHKQICQFLMEPKQFSGIGNYLKAEILYASRVKPNRTISTLTKDECQAIYDNILKIIYEAFKSGHDKFKIYFDPHGECGSSFQRAVYDKKVDPLGHTVIRSNFADGRTSHWVSEIQV